MAEFEAGTGPIKPLTPRRVTFDGTGGTLFGIYARNILLTVVTLGIYYFWGRNRTRGYLVTQCGFEGDRFAWHGTGKELFLGALKLLLIALPIVGVIGVVPVVWKSELAEPLANLAGAVFYAVVVPLAAVGSRRYRLSRLSWRGIRFSFRGRVLDYAKLLLRGLLLSAVTFGLYLPFFQTYARRFATEHSYFGNTRFAFDGTGRDLFSRFVAVVLVSVAAAGLVGVAVARAAVAPSLVQVQAQIPSRILETPLQVVVPLLAAVAVAGVAWFWFAAYRQRYFWGHTSFGTARFRSTITAGNLFLQSLTNLLLLIMTLGLATPWVVVRNAKFALANLRLDGSLDLAAVLQEAQAAAAAGESLADALDVDFFGLDLPL